MDKEWLESIFAKNKLIGNYDCNEDEYSSLLTETKEKCDLFIRTRIPFSSLEFKMVFVALVEIAKRWKLEDASDCDEERSGFWDYIFKTLMIGGNDRQKIYKEFTKGISTLGRQKITPVVNSGKQHYATLMMHAYSPRKSMNAFFELCYNVYKNDLDFGFTDGDNYICDIAANNTRSILDNTSFSENKSVAIGSNVYAIKIGLRSFSLHEDLKYDFINMFKRSFTLIDKAFHRENLLQQNRFDKLLCEWWKNKNETEFEIKLCGDKKIRTAMVSKQNISAKFLREDDTVFLCIPPIRLDSTTKSIWLSVYVGDEEKIFYSEQMLIKHGELSTSTKQKVFNINELLKMQTEIKMRVEIKEDGILLYNSGMNKDFSLNRDFMLFEDTKEIYSQVNKETNYFLYSLNIDKLKRKPTELTTYGKNIYNIYPHAGEVLAGKTRQVYFVDYSNKTNRSSPHLIGEIEDTEWRFDNLNCCVYNGVVKLLIPESASAKALELRIDNSRQFITEMLDEARDNDYCIFDITAFIPKDEPVEFSLYSYEKEKKLISQYIVIFSKLNLKFNESVYYGEMAHELRITDDDQKNQLSWQNSESEVIFPFREGELIIKVPYIRWKIDSYKWQNEPCMQTLWYKDYLNPGSILEIDNPETNKLLEICIVTEKAFEVLRARQDGKFEIGRAIFRHEGNKCVTVGFLNNGKDMRLVEYALQEQFVEIPIVYERDKVWWIPSKTFIGNIKSEFAISFASDEGEKFEVTDLTTRDEEIKVFKEGIYKYQIKIKEKSLFSKKYKVICEGEFIAGNANKFKFKNKRLMIKYVNLLEIGGNALMWNKLVPKYFVDDLEFFEDEEGAFYKGRLCVLSQTGILPLNSMKDRFKNYDKTNPVRIELRDNNTFWMIAGYQGNRDYIGDFFYDKRQHSICNIESEDEYYGEINLFKFEEASNV